MWVLKFILIIILSFSLVCGGLYIFLYLESINYGKVIDPLDPRFNPDEFVFNDYKNNKELGEALKILIHPGMHRKDAEKFLDGTPGKSGGRDVTDKGSFYNNGWFRKLNIYPLLQKADKVFYYSYGGNNKIGNPMFVGWHITVFYDKDDLVIQIIAFDRFLFEEEYSAMRTKKEDE